MRGVASGLGLGNLALESEDLRDALLNVVLVLEKLLGHLRIKRSRRAGGKSSRGIRERHRLPLHLLNDFVHDRCVLLQLGIDTSDHAVQLITETLVGLVQAVLQGEGAHLRLLLHIQHLLLELCLNLIKLGWHRVEVDVKTLGALAGLVEDIVVEQDHLTHVSGVRLFLLDPTQKLVEATRQLIVGERPLTCQGHLDSRTIHDPLRCRGKTGRAQVQPTGCWAGRRNWRRGGRRVPYSLPGGSRIRRTLPTANGGVDPKRTGSHRGK